MKSIKIIKTGAYFPDIIVENRELEEKFNLESGYIQKRTGIKTRYYTSKTQKEMAKKLIQKMFEDDKSSVQDIGLIIVSTTTPIEFMPGISNYIQKILEIENCICFDILAGCSGIINAIDIAQKYLVTSSTKKALIVGIEQLSKFLDSQDISTGIILSDGAGGLLLEKSEENKKYCSNMNSPVSLSQLILKYA